MFAMKHGIVLGLCENMDDIQTLNGVCEKQEFGTINLLFCRTAEIAQGFGIPTSLVDGLRSHSTGYIVCLNIFRDGQL